MTYVLCPRCNEQISEKAKICKYCGYQVSEFVKERTDEMKNIRCPSCEKLVPAVSKKCPACGCNISLQQWKSKSLFEKILDYISVIVGSKGSADF